MSEPNPEAALRLPKGPAGEPAEAQAQETPSREAARLALRGVWVPAAVLALAALVAVLGILPSGAQRLTDEEAAWLDSAVAPLLRPADVLYATPEGLAPDAADRLGRPVMTGWPRAPLAGPDKAARRFLWLSRDARPRGDAWWSLPSAALAEGPSLRLYELGPTEGGDTTFDLWAAFPSATATREGRPCRRGRLGTLRCAGSPPLVFGRDAVTIEGTPRRCLGVPAPARGSVKLTFPAVPLADALVVELALPDDAGNATPVRVSVQAGDRTLRRLEIRRKAGDKPTGPTSYRLPTVKERGQARDVTFELVPGHSGGQGTARLSGRARGEGGKR